MPPGVYAIPNRAILNKSKHYAPGVYAIPNRAILNKLKHYAPGVYAIPNRAILNKSKHYAPGVHVYAIPNIAILNKLLFIFNEGQSHIFFSIFEKLFPQVVLNNKIVLLYDLAIKRC